jgi:hypothetical protein
MGFLDIFINSENDGQPKETKAKESVTNTIFPPKENNVFPSTYNPPVMNVDDSYDDEFTKKTLIVYMDGLESLNQPGYDFYEYYKAISQGDINNLQMYPMAFSMATAMDNTLTKEKLINSAEYYLSEINKFYQNNLTKGNANKQELINQKNNENQSLVNQINTINQQIESLKSQALALQNDVNNIDTKYTPLIDDITNKLNANDKAKSKIVQLIETVKQNIQNTIK